jgi:transcriptional regulator with XRE-family HTH domain
MSGGDKFELVKPTIEELLHTPEARAQFEESSDLAEAARIVRTMRSRARGSEGSRGITQEALAGLLGVTQARISQIESGQGRDGLSFTLMKRIARACKVDWPGEFNVRMSARAPDQHVAAHRQARGHSAHEAVAQDVRISLDSPPKAHVDLQSDLNELIKLHEKLTKLSDEIVERTASGKKQRKILDAILRQRTGTLNISGAAYKVILSDKMLEVSPIVKLEPPGAKSKQTLLFGQFQPSRQLYYCVPTPDMAPAKRTEKSSERKGAESRPPFKSQGTSRTKSRGLKSEQGAQ